VGPGGPPPGPTTRRSAGCRTRLTNSIGSQRLDVTDAVRPATGDHIDFMIIRSIRYAGDTADDGRTGRFASRNLGDRRLPARTAVLGDQLIIGPIRHRSAPDPRTYNWVSSLPGWQPNRGSVRYLSNGYGASRSQDGQPDTALASSGSPRALNNVCCACWT